MPRSTEKAAAELTVIHWGSEEEKDLVAGWIAQFNEEYPDIKVEQIHVPLNYWDKVATMFAAGTPPDLMYMGYPEMVPYASEGTLLPLDDYMTEDPEMSTDLFFPSLIDAFTYDGKLYGVSKDWNTQVLYYNQALFDQIGLSYPDETWTWNDVLEAAKKMTGDTDGNGVTDQWGFVTDVGMNRIGAWIYGNGGSILSEDKTQCTLTDPASVEALAFITGMMFEDKVAPSKVELGELSAKDTFSSGKAGMYVCGGWRVLGFRDITDFGWDIAPIPLSPTSGERGTVVDTVSWSIAKGTEYPDAAWELLKFFTGEAGQMRTAEGGIATPSMIEYANSEAFLDPTQLPEHREVLISYTQDEIHTYPVIPKMGEMWGAWSQELSEMWLGQKSVEDSVKAFCECIEPALPASGTIDAGGGSLTSNDGNTTLDFPSGAVTTTVVITYTPQRPWPTGDLLDIDHFFDLAGGTISGTIIIPVTTVLKPYTITVSYTDTVLVNVDESTLALYHLAGCPNCQWEKVVPSGVDMVNNVVTATLNHLSRFGIMGERQYRIYLPLTLKNY
jgi:multiple sugar transport system substrate-binding protein